MLLLDGLQAIARAQQGPSQLQLALQQAQQREQLTQQISNLLHPSHSNLAAASQQLLPGLAQLYQQNDRIPAGSIHQGTQQSQVSSLDNTLSWYLGRVVPQRSAPTVAQQAMWTNNQLLNQGQGLSTPLMGQLPTSAPGRNFGDISGIREGELLSATLAKFSSAGQHKALMEGATVFPCKARGMPKDHNPQVGNLAVKNFEFL